MSISYQSAGAIAGVASGDISLAPGSIADNDIELGIFISDNDNTLTVARTNWSNESSSLIVDNGGSTFRTQVLWHRASSESGAQLFTATGSANLAGFVAAYRGAKTTSSPIHKVATASGTGTAVSVDLSGANAPTVNGCKILLIVTVDGEVNTLSAYAGGSLTWAEDSEQAEGTASFKGIALASADQTTAAGLTITATISASTTWNAIAIALEPAPSYSVEQEGYRFRADDGSETSATWLAAQDIDIARALALNTRLRMLLNATLDPPTTQYQLEYKQNSGSYKKIEVPDGAAVAWGANGTLTTTGTTAPTVAYPAGITAGQQLVLVVVNRPNTSAVTKPSGWDDIDTITGGAGSEGAGTGTIRLTAFKRIADGTESGSLTLSITSGTSVCAVIFRCTRGLGKDFLVESRTGADSSAGTAVSVGFGSPLAYTAGDLVLVAFASSEDTATFASETLTATGTTTGTLNERIEQAVTTGNDCKLLLCEFPITAGPASAAATFAATASGTNSANVAGPAMLIRISQIDAPCIISPSSNITASGEATTAQLAAPSGKSTSDFVTGRMQDDENPADTIDITSDDYTEIEWCIKIQAPAVDADVFQFRATPAATYAVTPQITIGSSTANLTGVAGTGSVGALTAIGTANVSPTGVAGTGSVGTLSANITASVTGVQAIGSPGSVTEQHAAAITPAGVAGAGAVGTLSATAGVTASPPSVSATGSPGTISQTHTGSQSITGVSGTGQVGTLAPPVSVDMTLIGTEGIGGVGSVTQTHTGSVTPTGVAGAGAVGTLSASAAGAVTASPVGVAATATVGSVSATGLGNTSPTGVSGLSVVGAITISMTGSAAPMGVSAASTVGILVAAGPGIAAVFGVSATTAVGTLVPSGSVLLTGVQATGSAGSLSARGDAIANVLGVACAGYAGVISFTRFIPPAQRIFKVPSAAYRIGRIRFN